MSGLNDKCLSGERLLDPKGNIKKDEVKGKYFVIDDSLSGCDGTRRLYQVQRSTGEIRGRSARLP